MLFIDFILSQDAQKIFQKLGYASGRTDLPAADNLLLVSRRIAN